MSHGPAQPVAPRDPRMKEAWRAAAKAYRGRIGGLQSADPSFSAAAAAVLQVMPELTAKEANAVAVKAVSYASQVAPEWLYALNEMNALARGG